MRELALGAVVVVSALGGCAADEADFAAGNLEPLPVAVSSRTGLILVEWDPSEVVARIDGFSAERAPDRDGPFEEIYFLDRSRRAFVDVTPREDSGDRWYYRVTGFEGSRPVAGSEVSAAASTTILPSTHIEQAPPSLLETNAATLRWSGESVLGEGSAELFTWRLDEDPWSDPTAEREATLLALGVGAHRLQVRAIDDRGNQDPSPAEALFEVLLDHEPEVLIAGGTIATAEREVSLRLRARDVAEVQISEEARMSGAEWLPYAAAATFVLSEGEGQKIIYARYRTDGGEETAIVSDAILLDETPPVPTISYPVEGGDPTVADAVTVFGSVEDLSPVTVRALGLETTDQAGTFTLLEVPLQVGENNLIVEFEDAVGLRADARVTVWRHPGDGTCAF